jgi:hypothetical protein
VYAALSHLINTGGAETPAQAPVDAAGEAEFLWMAVLLSLLPLQKKKSLGSFSVLLSRS